MAFRIISIERTSRGLEKSTIFVAETRADAEKDLAKAKKAFPGESIGIEEIKPKEPGFRTVVIPGSRAERDTGTTRSPAEQRRIEAKAASLALANIRAGRSQASAATIRRLQAQELTQKEFVERRTLERLRTGTTATFAPGASLARVQADTRAEIARQIQQPVGTLTGQTLTDLQRRQLIAAGQVLPRPIPLAAPLPPKRQSFFGFEGGTLRIGRSRALGFLTETKPPSEREVFLFALPGGAFLGKARKAPKLFQAAKRAVPKVKAAVTKVKATKAVTFLRETRPGRFIAGLGQAAAVGEAARVGVETTGRITTPREQRPFLRTGIAAGIRAEEQVTLSQPFIKRLAADLSLGFSTQQAKDAFKKEIRSSLTKQGLTGEQLDKAVSAVERQRKFVIAGEAAALLGISGSVELTGSKGIIAAFKRLGLKKVIVPEKKIGRKLFVTGFKEIAPAGIIEGVTQEAIQQRARRRPFDIKAIGTVGAIGGATAGVLGGGIVGLKIPKPKVSKVLEFGSFIVDPFEKPGDILAAATRKAGAKITGKQVEVPKIFPGVTKATRGAAVISFAPITIPKVKAPVIAPSITPKKPVITPVKRIKSLEQILTPPIIKAPTIPTFPFVPTPIGLPTITGAPTPTPIPTPTGVPTPTPTPTTPTPAEVPTGVPTITPVSVPITFPIVTPQLRVPPPLPILIPFGAGGIGV